MPDENRVFDVTKPKDVSPSATSKPVIVGHHPIVSDSMVKDTDAPAEEPTQIRVVDETEHKSESEHETESSHAEEHSPLDNSAVPPEAAAIFSDPEESHPEDPHADEPAEPPQPAAEPAVFSEAPDPGPKPADEPTPPDDEAMPALAETDHAPPPHIEELHFSDKNIKRSWWKPVLLVILLLLIGAYLAVDSGLVRGYSHLPFHFFKQKTVASSNTASSQAPVSPPVPSTPFVPAGFKKYQLSGTNMTFAAPLTWGSPTSSVDLGYSKRGTGQQSDGTHAYLVSFAGNKSIQLVVTSSQYLPPARSPQYFDYLQWCTGTNDGQFYQSTLLFTTANGVDTPSTVVCNQGPLLNVTKLDAKTIMQSKVTDTSGKVIGDIYTKNLSDPNLVVIRVVDAAMTNSAAIKQLLSTVQFSANQ